MAYRGGDKRMTDLGNFVVIGVALSICAFFLVGCWFDMDEVDGE